MQKILHPTSLRGRGKTSKTTSNTPTNPRGIMERLRSRFSKQEAKSQREEPPVHLPILIEFDDYKSYPTARKYRELHAYMERYPYLEKHIFDYFYIQVKPLIDSDGKDRQNV